MQPEATTSPLTTPSGPILRNLGTDGLSPAPLALSSWVLRGKQIRTVTPWLLLSRPTVHMRSVPTGPISLPNKHSGLGLEKLPTYNEFHELDYDLGSPTSFISTTQK